MVESNIQFPVEPGHMGIDWAVAAFLHPTRKVTTSIQTIGGTSYTIPAPIGRREFLIQMLSTGILWICFNGPAVVGQGFKIQGGIFGMPMAPNVDVSLIAEGGSVNVFIFQAGM